MLNFRKLICQPSGALWTPGEPLHAADAPLELLPFPHVPGVDTPLSDRVVRKVLVVDCLDDAQPVVMGLVVCRTCSCEEFLVALTEKLEPTLRTRKPLQLAALDGLNSDRIQMLEPEDVVDDEFFRHYHGLSNGPDGWQFLVAFLGSAQSEEQRSRPRNRGAKRSAASARQEQQEVSPLSSWRSRLPEGGPGMDPSALPTAPLPEAVDPAWTAEDLRRHRVRAFECLKEICSSSLACCAELRARSNGPEHGAVVADVSLVSTSRPNANPRREGELVVKLFTWRCGFKGSIFAKWSTLIGWDAKMPLMLTAKVLATGATVQRDTNPCAQAQPPQQQGRQQQRAAARGSTSGAGSSRSRQTAPEERLRQERARAREVLLQAQELETREVVPAIDRKKPSMPDLLKVMESGERSAAAQPAGLTVALRPYQLQSLDFMLGLERLVDANPPPCPQLLDSALVKVQPQRNELRGQQQQAGAAAAEDSGGSDSDDQDLSVQRLRAWAHAMCGKRVRAEEEARTGRSRGQDAGVTCPGGFRHLFWLPITNSRGVRYWFSPFFERIAEEVPHMPVGGFLAEEMGLGKTVETLALILANPAPRTVQPGSILPGSGLDVSRATLVVCPESLVGQWRTEAQEKTNGACSIYVDLGGNDVGADDLADYDIVVTTYNALVADDESGGPFMLVYWHRVVFDEGHFMRDYGGGWQRAARSVISDRRWLVSSTPVCTSVHDLKGQCAALHMLPVSNTIDFYSNPLWTSGRKEFRREVITPESFRRKDKLKERQARPPMPLLYLLRSTVIRHTREQRYGDQALVQLPTKIEADVAVHLGPAEQALYLRVHHRVERDFRDLLARPKIRHHVPEGVSNALLLRLRGLCSGLLPASEDNVSGAASPGAASGAAAMLQLPPDLWDCPICCDGIDEPVATKCLHWFCRECITGWLRNAVHKNCPACRQAVDITDLRPGVRPPPPTAQGAGGAGGSAAAGAASASAPAATARSCDSKLRAVVAELRAMREADPSAKALVFSQFSRALELLQPILTQEGFQYSTLTGDISQAQGDEAIQSFQQSPDVSVFLLSMRAGANSITLTAANHVFLMEPCINPALEEQIAGRSWRMGQTRPVQVKRFFMQGTVEEQIIAVANARRLAISGAGGSALGPGPSTSSDAVQTSKTAPPRTVVGCLDNDIGKRWQVEELEQLFSKPRFTAPTPGLPGQQARSAAGAP